MRCAKKEKWNAASFNDNRKGEQLLTCPLCYRLWGGVKVSGHDDAWWDTCCSMDTWQNGQTERDRERERKKIPQEQEVKIPHAVRHRKPGRRSGPPARSVPTHLRWPAPWSLLANRARSGTDGQVLVTDTMHLVKQHPPLQTAAHSQRSPPSYVHYFIHITVSGTFTLTYNINLWHFPQKDSIEFFLKNSM